MRDVKAVGDGRLDTWEAVRMNERSYWDQFLKPGVWRIICSTGIRYRKEMRSGTGRSYTRAARLLRPSVQRRRDRMGNNMQDRIKVLGDRSEGRTDRGV